MCAATGILPQKNVGCFLSGGFPISNWRLGRSTKGVPGDIMLPAVFVHSRVDFAPAGKALRKVHGVRLTHIDHSYS